jgi:hypothetical protein
MQWKDGSRTALDLGGCLRNELFVEKDVKIKVYREIHDQATRITKSKAFPYLTVLSLDKSLPNPAERLTFSQSHHRLS